MATVQKMRQVELVGRKIRQLRKEHRLTQTDLARRIGIQQSDLSRMEKGEYRVSLDTLVRILSELDVSVGQFFEDAARETITPRDMRVVSEINALSPADRQEVEDFITFKRQQRGPTPVGVVDREDHDH